MAKIIDRTLSDDNIIGGYVNGNSVVKLYSDGTKVRSTSDDEFKPIFAESMDLTITEKCDGGCPYCYADCTQFGKHMDLKDETVMAFLNSIHQWTEVAINLNDMSWNELPVFLKMMKEKNVVVSGTINVKHVTDDRLRLLKTWQRNKMIYGIGLSVDDFAANSSIIAETMAMLENVVIHAIAGVISERYVQSMLNFQLRHRIKLLLLGFKEHCGRGISYSFTRGDEIKRNIEMLKKSLSDILGTVKVLAMDNLAMEQLEAKKYLMADSFDHWDKIYMGDEGEFTFFANLVTKKFGISSMVPKDEMMDLLPDSTECFRIIREKSGHGEKEVCEGAK